MSFSPVLTHAWRALGTSSPRPTTWTDGGARHAGVWTHEPVPVEGCTKVVWRWGLPKRESGDPSWECERRRKDEFFVRVGETPKITK